MNNYSNIKYKVVNWKLPLKNLGGVLQTVEVLKSIGTAISETAIGKGIEMVLENTGLKGLADHWPKSTDCLRHRSQRGRNPNIVGNSAKF